MLMTSLSAYALAPRTPAAIKASRSWSLRALQEAEAATKAAGWATGLPTDVAQATCQRAGSVALFNLGMLAEVSRAAERSEVGGAGQRAERGGKARQRRNKVARSGWRGKCGKRSLTADGQGRQVRRTVLRRRAPGGARQRVRGGEARGGRGAAACAREAGREVSSVTSDTTNLHSPLLPLLRGVYASVLFTVRRRLSLCEALIWAT